MGERMCIMRDGRVVQIGAPLEIYRNPVDTFVAGFLASPPMNLLDARLVEEAGNIETELSGTRIAVPPARRAALEGYGDRAITFGIRPEDLYTEAGAGSHAPVDVTVVTVEALGPEVVLVASLPDGQEMAARLGRDFRAPVGSKLRLYADLETLHLFDPENGQAITDGR